MLLYTYVVYDKMYYLLLYIYTFFILYRHLQKITLKQVVQNNKTFRCKNKNKNIYICDIKVLIYFNYYIQVLFIPILIFG